MGQDVFPKEILEVEFVAQTGRGCRAGKTYRNPTHFTQSPKCKIGRLVSSLREER